ncbi:MAG: zf-HC2 domain-containing protein [Desulfomonilaceae bacterium]
MNTQPSLLSPHPKDLLLLYVENLLPTHTKTAVMNHLEECPECLSEVEMLSRSVSLLKTHKEVFCPEPWELAEYAIHGDDCSGSVTRHIAHCPSCAQEFHELSQPAPTAIPDKLWAAIQEECAARQERVNREPWFKGLAAHAERVAASLRMPIMGVGAAAAAILVLVLIQAFPRGAGEMVALSPVAWQNSSSGLVPKGPINLMGAAKKKPSAAIVIRFNSRKDALSSEQIDALYERLKPAGIVSNKFKVLTPRTIQTQLGLTGVTPMTRSELLSELHEKCGVSLAALVSLARRGDGYEASVELVELPSQSVAYQQQVGPFPLASLGEQLKTSVHDGFEDYLVR